MAEKQVGFWLFVLAWWSILSLASYPMFWVGLVSAALVLEKIYYDYPLHIIFKYFHEIFGLFWDRRDAQFIFYLNRLATQRNDSPPNFKPRLWGVNPLCVIWPQGPKQDTRPKSQNCGLFVRVLMIKSVFLTPCWNPVTLWYDTVQHDVNYFRESTESSRLALENELKDLQNKTRQEAEARNEIQAKITRLEVGIQFQANGLLLVLHADILACNRLSLKPKWTVDLSTKSTNRRWGTFAGHSSYILWSKKYLEFTHSFVHWREWWFTLTSD